MALHSCLHYAINIWICRHHDFSQDQGDGAICILIKVRQITETETIAHKRSQSSNIAIVDGKMACTNLEISWRKKNNSLCNWSLSPPYICPSCSNIMPAGEQILGVNFLRRERSKGDVFQTAAAAIQKKNEDVYVFLQVLLPSFLPSFPHLSSTIAKPPVLLCGRRRRSLIFQQHGSRLPRLCSEAFLKQDKRSECILMRVCSYFCFPRKRWGGGGIKPLIVCCCNRVCDARHRSAYLSIASRERRLFDRKSVLLRVASFLRVVVCTELVAVGVLRRLFFRRSHLLLS